MISFGTPTTISQLSVGDLLGAAPDLRNASLVVRHAGHFSGALVDKYDAKVCQVGAIELATYKMLVTSRPYADWPGEHVFHTISRQHWIGGGVTRCDAAILVLADTLPDTLCDECDPAADTITTRQPWEKVVHYNDVHVPTAALAAGMLNLAADHAENLAAQRRLAHDEMRVAV